MPKHIAIAAVTLAVLAASGTFFFMQKKESSAHAYISPSDPQQVARGKAIYASQCASCHGADLQGQPNWRQRRANGRLPAPPHDQSGHTWHHPDALLIDIIKNGLVPGKTAPDAYESDMPAFGKTLADADIVAVLAYIKSTWPADILDMQKTVTLQRNQP